MLVLSSLPQGDTDRCSVVLGAILDIGFIEQMDDFVRMHFSPQLFRIKDITDSVRKKADGIPCRQ